MANNALSQFFRRWVSRANRPGGRVRTRPATTRLGVEAFEDRVVPAALPPALVDGTTVFTGGVINPQSALDPANPNKMVVAWTNGTSLIAQSSVDGGVSWTTFLTTVGAGPNDPQDPAQGGSATSPNDWRRINADIDPQGRLRSQRVFTNTWAPSVVIGRDETIYISCLETDATKTSGVLVVRSFNWGGGSVLPTKNDLDLNGDLSVNAFAVYDNVVYRWNGQDPALNPKLGIDNGLPTFTDPDTGTTVSDSMYGTGATPGGKGVFLVWNSNATTASIGIIAPNDLRAPDPYVPWTPSAANPRLDTTTGQTFNPNAIVLAASADQGRTFSTPVLVNDSGYAARPGDPDLPGTEPQVIFTQTQVTNTAVQPGSMSVLWSDVGTTATAGGNIRIDTTTPDNGATGTDAVAVVTAEAQYNPGQVQIPDAIANTNGGADIAQFVQRSIAVTLPSGINAADAVTDLDVTVRMVHQHMNHVNITLTSPGGQVYTLVENRIDGQGKTILNRYNNPQGLPDQPNLGVVQFGALPNVREVPVGTVFDSEAPRYITDSANSPFYTAHFRPENFNDLSSLYAGRTLANMVGTWTLTITDVKSDGQNAIILQYLDSWNLKFTAQLDNERFQIGNPGPNGPKDDTPARQDQLVTGGVIPGDWDNNNPVKPASGLSPTVGIGSGVSAAYDQSIGASALYAGRLYVAYARAVPGNTDSNIAVVFSDNGGATWSAPVTISGTDSVPTSLYSGGRWQFMPTITVDPVTGQVVCMWYDAGNDAQNGRVATYLSVSNDGGQTWSPGVYLNNAKTAIDAVTGQEIKQEPIPSNLANAGANGFGNRQSVLAYAGKITPFWVGNANAGGVAVYTANVATAAGPRVSNADLGQITANATARGNFLDPVTLAPVDIFGRGYTNVLYNNSFAADGTRQLDGFLVTFDRPVDISTVGADDFTAFYRDPTGTTAPGTPVAIGGVFPVSTGLVTRGTLTLDDTYFVKFATPQNKVGTYSYSVGPAIRDKILTTGGIAPVEIPEPATTLVTARQAYLAQFRDPFANTTPVLVLPNAGTPFGPPAATSAVTVPAPPAGNDDLLAYQVIVDVNINAPDVTALQLELVGPAGQVVVLFAPGNGRNGLLDGGLATALTDTRFDDLALRSIAATGADPNNSTPTSTDDAPYTRSWKPAQFLGTFRGTRLDGTWTLRVRDFGGEGAQINSFDVVIRPGIDTSPTLTATANGAGALVVTFPTAPPSFTAANIGGVSGPASGTAQAPYTYTVTPVAGNPLQYTITRTPYTGTSGSAGGFVPGQTYVVSTTAVFPTPANFLDQNANAENQQFATLAGRGQSNDVLSVPTPVNGQPFQLPFVTTSLPLSIPGPHVTSTFVPGQAVTPKSAVQSGTRLTQVQSVARQVDGSLIVTFASATAMTAADLVSVNTPTGTAAGPYTVAAFGNTGTKYRITRAGGFASGTSYTVTLASTNGNPANALLVTFDRPVDPTSFDATDIISIKYTSATNATPIQLTGPFTVIPVSNAFPGQPSTQFYITRTGGFTGPATYALTVGNDIQASDELSLNAGANSLIVAFDRDMRVNTFTAADVLKLTGPAGPVALPAGSVTVTPYAQTAAQIVAGTARQFKVTFPTQTVAGPYSVEFGSDIRSQRADGGDPAGDAVDTNLNAGINVLRGGDPTAAVSLRNSYTSTDGPIPLSDNGTVSLPIDVNEAFLIAQAATAKQLPPIQSAVWQQNGTILVSFPTAPASFNSSDVVAVTSLTLNTTIPGPYTVTPVPGDATRFVISTGSSSYPNGFPSGQYSVSVANNPHIQVQLDVDISNDGIPDLIGELVAPDGTRITLFTNVGKIGNPPKNAFSDTIFDDFGSTPIQLGSAPFDPINPSNPSDIKTYNPQFPLSQLVGHGSQGEWRLEITNTGSNPGTLNYWRLLLPFTQPGTGLGEAVADRFQAGFRVFIQDPTNPLAHTQWTPMGPGSINGTQTNAQNTGTTVGQGANAGRVTAIAVDPADPSGNTVFAGGSSGGIWKTTNFLTQDPLGPTWIPLTDFGVIQSLNIASITTVGRNNDPSKTMVFALTGDPNTQRPINTQYGTPGVGVLRSLDGGKTWQVLDSMQNVADPNDPQSPILPFLDPGRDHTFFNAVGYKIVADPSPSPTGEAVLYMATSMNGLPQTNPAQTGAGVWRSLDSGRTWTLIQAGEATDVSLVAASVGPTGNRTTLYAAVRGRGVFITQNATAISGATGMQAANGGSPANPLLRNNNTALPFVGSSALPTGASVLDPALVGGRIAITTPAQTGNPLLDSFYSRWVYAVVIYNDAPDPVTGRVSGQTIGVFESKDFGQTWTRIRLAVNGGATSNEAGSVLADEDPTRVGGFPRAEQGEEDLAIVLDPQNPRIAYVGGIGASNGFATAGMIRVDTTNIKDAYNFTFYNNSDNVGTPVIQENTTGGTLSDRLTSPELPNNQPPHPAHGALNFFDPADPLFIAGYYEKVAGAGIAPGAIYPEDFINLTRDPNNPFITPTTLQVIGSQSITNNGTDVYWSDISGALAAFEGNNGTVGLNNNIQQLVPVFDPTTGQTRLIFATGHGVYTGIDTGYAKQFDRAINPARIGFTPFAFSTRNGNLQIAQLYSGTAQPSQLAADVAGAFYYGMSRDNGFPVSNPNILQTGNLNGRTLINDPITGDIQDPTGTGVQTDPQGTGIAYQFRFPNESGPGSQLPTDFLRAFFSGSDPGRTGTGQTGPNGASLIQSLPGQVVDDPTNNVGQWPNQDAKDPYGASTGQQAPSQTMGYFAVNPYDKYALLISSGVGRVFLSKQDPSTGALLWTPVAQPGQLDGTIARATAFGAPNPANQGGGLSQYLFAGTLGGNVFVSTNGGGTWRNMSVGLDGSPVMQIIANPTRGKFDAFAVTSTGVFYIKDATAAPGTPQGTWQNITGNLFQLQKPMFNQAGDNFQTLSFLSTIAVDWRYVFPLDQSNPTDTRPNVYVGGFGGVYKLRSLTGDIVSSNLVADWSSFPDNNPIYEGSAVTGGYLPNVEVTHLDLSLGNLDPVSGLPVGDVNKPAGGLNLLTATTFGRGAFSIRLSDTTDEIQNQGGVNTVVQSGPKVLQILNPNPLGGPSDRLTVKFDGPVDPNTFKADDIVLLKQLGGGNTQVIPITTVNMISTATANSANPRNLFEFIFPQQVGQATYSLVIGPNLTDLAGNLMNQDGDLTNGEALEDQYRTTVTLNGSTANLTVSTLPAIMTAGSPATFTVTATDANGTTLTGFNGTVTITSSDVNGSINGGGPTLTTTLTNGTGTFTVAFQHAGTQSVTVTTNTAGVNPGGSQTTVVAAGSNHFLVTGTPTTIVAGQSATYTVTAVDQYGNVATTYNGPVYFTDTDTQATYQNSPVAPPVNTITLANGVGSFTLTLRTAGGQTVTVVDNPNSPTVVGTATTTVQAGAAVRFVVTASTTQVVAGTPFAVTVTALDQYANVARGYTGTVTFTSSDLQAALPPDATLANGTRTFTVTLNTTGTQFVRATDVSNPGVTGVQTGINVSSSPLPPLPPSPTTALPSAFGVGSGMGGQSVVKVFDKGGTPLASFTPFPAGFAGQVDPTSQGFTGGHRVAVGDVTGDGVADYVVGSGPTISSFVRVFDGKTGAEVITYSPFEASFKGGVYVTLGDLDGDGTQDIVITPDEGGGPRVLVLRGGDFAQIANFYGINDPNFRGGARAAVGDINGDGRNDLAVAAGFGGGPRVSVFDGRTVLAGSTPTNLFGDFFIFDGPDAETLRNGAFITVGDVDGDGFADVIGGGGPGGGPRVFGLSGQDLLRVPAPRARVVANFFAGPDSSRGGVHLAAKNLDGDRFADLVVGSGDGDGSHVTLYQGSSLAAGGQGIINQFDAFPGDFSGVYVG